MSEPPSNSDPIAEECAAAMAVLAVAAQQPGAAGDIWRAVITALRVKAAAQVIEIAARRPGVATQVLETAAQVLEAAAREPGSVGEFARKTMRDLRHPPTD